MLDFTIVRKMQIILHLLECLSSKMLALINVFNQGSVFFFKSSVEKSN